MDLHIIDKRKISSYIRQLMGKLNALDVSLQTQPSAYSSLSDDIVAKKKLKLSKSNTVTIKSSGSVAEIHLSSIVSFVVQLCKLNLG